MIPAFGLSPITKHTGVIMAEQDGWQAIARDGISGKLEDWLTLNLSAVGSKEGETVLAAFPPAELMEVTTGLTEPIDFATHGVHFVRELAQASPKPLSSFSSILDFGCGVGRLARLFKGFSGRYVGVDVDKRTVEWVRTSLPYVSANLNFPHEPLPFKDGEFACVISLSVFTHLTERDHLFYLSELCRVTQAGGILLLTVHGARALHRALTEEFVFNLVWCPREELEEADQILAADNGYKFIRQLGHLTSDNYEYGITFMAEDYVRNVWSRYFDVVDYRSGAIHDFQDIVVLTRKY